MNNPHGIRVVRILTRQISIPVGLVAAGGVFIVKMAYEVGVKFDTNSLIKGPWEAMGYFYRVDSYNGIGTWFRAVRRNPKSENGWELVHQNTEMPFCCTADMRVYLIEGTQLPRRELQLLPPHPQLNLPLPP